MLDNNIVEKELLDFIGEDGFKMLQRFYKDYGTVFPIIVEDKIPINVNYFYGRSIRNYLNEKLNIVPNEIKDWTTYEDYIYNMLIRLVKKGEFN